MLGFTPPRVLASLRTCKDLHSARTVSHVVCKLMVIVLIDAVQVNLALLFFPPMMLKHDYMLQVL